MCLLTKETNAINVFFIVKMKVVPTIILYSLPGKRNTAASSHLDLTLQPYADLPTLTLLVFSSVYVNQSPNHKIALIVAPLHAMSAFLNYILSPVFKTTRLQSSHHLSMEHILDMIEKYKVSLQSHCRNSKSCRHQTLDRRSMFYLPLGSLLDGLMKATERHYFFSTISL